MLFGDWRRNRYIVCLAIYASAGVVILLLFFGARSVGIDFYTLTKDPLAGLDLPGYTGVLSNLGIVAWCFTSAIQFFASWTTRRLNPASQTAPFLFWSGLVTLFLMLDDLLMLHEQASDVFETLIFAGYAALVVLVFGRFWRVISRTNYFILGIAFVSFAVSALLDSVVLILSIEVPYRTFLEDAFKLIGLVGWVFYFIKLSVDSVKETM